jgi:hypothetical protein
MHLSIAKGLPAHLSGRRNGESAVAILSLSIATKSRDKIRGVSGDAAECVYVYLYFIIAHALAYRYEV